MIFLFVRAKLISQQYGGSRGPCIMTHAANPRCFIAFLLYKRNRDGNIYNVPTHLFFMDPTSVQVTTHNNSRRKRQRVASFLADYSRLWATDQD